eukprot:TRINITY_DN31654_c0_g1_i4.p1 TRINITY_DN31654_c0_g1~~TRINITY_DN31654_c0_g1_i4.p1  ORF type:complete len:253 (+),score=25.23 TRINITY_DN31654_c0_g1_i4:83-841(+)
MQNGVVVQLHCSGRVCNGGHHISVTRLLAGPKPLRLRNSRTCGDAPRMLPSTLCTIGTVVSVMGSRRTSQQRRRSYLVRLRSQDGHRSSSASKPWTGEEILSRVDVRAVPGRGNCLFTKSSVSAGELLFAEAPIFQSAPEAERALLDATMAACRAFPGRTLPPAEYFAALMAVRDLEGDAAKSFQSKFFPRDDTDCSVEQALLKSPGVLECLDETAIGKLDAESWHRAVLVLQYNSFSLEDMNDMEGLRRLT